MFTRKAFTMVEVLVVLGIMSLLGGAIGGAYVYVLPEIHGMGVNKDCKTLNDSLTTYLTTGGSIAPTATIQDVVQSLKAIPSANLMKQSVAMRNLLGPTTGLSLNAASDNTPRLTFVYPKFVVATSGTGYLLDKSGNIPVTTESRPQTSASFATTSKWVWDYKDPAGSSTPASGSGPTITLTTSAPNVAGVYTITAPGSYTFTSTTNATAGTLLLTAGGTNDQTTVSSGSQSVTVTVSIGPGASYTLPAGATINAPTGSATAGLQVVVNTPANSQKLPTSLVITGPTSVTLRSSNPTQTNQYYFTLTYSDGSTDGPHEITDLTQELFTWVNYTPGTTRSIKQSYMGMDATLLVDVIDIPSYQVIVTSSDLIAGSAAITSPVGGQTYFDAGTQVTVTEVANLNYQSSGFSGTLTGPGGSFSFTLMGDTSLTANFISSPTPTPTPTPPPPVPTPTPTPTPPATSNPATTWTVTASGGAGGPYSINITVNDSGGVAVYNVTTAGATSTVSNQGWSTGNFQIIATVTDSANNVSTQLLNINLF